jgi:UDP-2,3-diacylglucosamine pyrophosphatase LpxH
VEEKSMDVGGIVVEEAYVVSDLHLGGELPFQIFSQGASLAALIDDLAQRASLGGRRAFVINGDFVDFLAERDAKHFNVRESVRQLRRIAEDQSFKPVFDALRRFVRHPGCLLAIALGNHDIELALPWVRSELQDILCAGDEAAAGRLFWSLNGEGVLLRIGRPNGPQVFCTHGNEVDGWNVVEHEALRKFARAGQRGEPLDADYKPNPGSRMVIDVMNDVKKRYPFVDLLKPETATVIPVLLALDQASADKLRQITDLMARKVTNDARIAAGLLGVAEEPIVVMDDAASAQSSFVATLMKAEAQAGKQQNTLSLLDAAETRFRAGHLAIDLVDAAERGETLGLWDAAVGYAKSRGDVVEGLRGQLAGLAKDRSFDISDEDETYRALVKKVSLTVDYLVTGHTHLARAITREYARSYYFNTGTWARVFRIEPHVLGSAYDFRQLFAALSAGTLQALDNAAGLIAVEPHFAAFWRDDEGVHGELRQLVAQGGLLWTPVQEKFTRS